MALLTPSSGVPGSRLRTVVKLGFGLVAVAAAAVIVSAAAAAQPRPVLEYDLKAVFLLNFSRFVEWPAEAFSSAETPFTIGILGEDPFGRRLDEIVKNESVEGRRLVAKRYRHVQDIGTCQILFVSGSESKDLEDILVALEGRPILTVGEAAGFSSRGGMIHFVVEEGRVRLRINAGAAKSAKLTLSSKLLRLAEIVGEPRVRR